MSDEKIKVEAIKSNSFKQIYAIGVLGGHNPYDFRMAFYNESSKKDDRDTKIERIIEAEVILSPTAAKELAVWLTSHVTEYENTFGQIKMPKEVINQPKKLEIEKIKEKSETASYIG